MTTRIKAMTVLAAMALTFAILPTFGAAADTLEPGDYVVTVGDESYGFTVTEDGEPQVDDSVPLGVVFQFESDDDGLLKTFTVIVNDIEHEVEAEPVEGAEPVPNEPEDPESLDPPTTPEAEAPATDEDGTDEGPATVEAEQTHGALVSAVAKCTLNGRDARNADLRTHGYYVSAAAARETVDIEGQSFDLATMEGVDGFCVLMRELEDPLDAAEAPPAEGESVDEAGEEPDETRGNGNGQAKQAEKDTGKPDHAGPKGKDKD